ncbi:MAG TPA: polyprenyl synthetase family protein [Pyrinomonadaceae bacterium]|nr:polyprenyl synthetase family protein [Pyrinomonadaceae bacterium]
MQTFAARKQEVIDGQAARKIFGLISTEMSLVEAEYQRQAASNVEVINYLGDYLRASGGKRIRPALLILSSIASGGRGDTDSIIRMATVMEMLHTATLVHDDIIDNADLRRNRTSVNARFGNQAAVLMGDWLYMSAFETSLKQRSLEILDILIRLTRKMTEGELIQMTRIGDLAISEDQYFDILKRKTAYLFSGCCEIGAMLSGAALSQRAALRDYGMNLGIAFQLADDTLDFTSDQEVMGKAAGADLLEGKMTLPLIRLIHIDRSVRGILEKVIDTGIYSDETRSNVNSRLFAHGILEDTKRIALEYAETARKSLDVFPETEYRSALDAIPNFVVQRNK